MGKHRSKEFDQYIDQAIELGFRIKKNGIVYVLYPPDKKYPMHTFHKGVPAVHEIRRYLKKYLDFTGNKI